MYQICLNHSISLADCNQFSIQFHQTFLTRINLVQWKMEVMFWSLPINLYKLKCFFKKNSILWWNWKYQKISYQTTKQWWYIRTLIQSPRNWFFFHSCLIKMCNSLYVHSVNEDRQQCERYEVKKEKRNKKPCKILCWLDQK